MLRVEIYHPGNPGVRLVGRLWIPSFLPWWPRRLPLLVAVRLDRPPLR
jgi:hypothetical protein